MPPVLDFLVLDAAAKQAYGRIQPGGEPVKLRDDGCRDLAPGDIVEVDVTRRWRYGGWDCLAGLVTPLPFAVERLGLEPLAVDVVGTWDPAAAFADRAAVPMWAMPLVEAGPRPVGRLRTDLLDAGDEHYRDQVIAAAELILAGEEDEARSLLGILTRRDLRHLDAHAFLGSAVLESNLLLAERHHRIGRLIGEAVLPDGFAGVLPWTVDTNRGFLRCLHGHGLVLWLLGDRRGAEDAFRRCLWFDPDDGQRSAAALAELLDGALVPGGPPASAPAVDHRGADDPDAARFAVARWRSLPVDPDAVWEGVGRPLDLQGGRPVGPGGGLAASLWCDAASGIVGAVDATAVGDLGAGLMLDLLLKFASGEGGGRRPARLVLDDPALADALDALLAGTGTTVAAVPLVPAAEEAFTSLRLHMQRGAAQSRTPAELAGFYDDVPLEAVRGFAAAACEFAAAAPWRMLADLDLLAVKAPRPPVGMACAMVLGGAGHQFGLGLAARREQHEEILAAPEGARIPDSSGPLWNVGLDLPGDLPPELVAAWRTLKLPVTPGGRLPVFFGVRGVDSFTPDAAAVRFATGLLRAVAASTLAQLDQGAWSVTVPGGDGPERYELELEYVVRPPTRRDLLDWGIEPDLRGNERGIAALHRGLAQEQAADLDELQAIMERKYVGRPPEELLAFAPVPDDPASRAQDLCWQAFDAFGFNRGRLARQALAIDPDCVDARVILAEEDEDDAERCYELYRDTVRSAEARLDADALLAEAGELHGVLPARPLLRALAGLTSAALDTNRPAEALAAGRRSLQLDPYDHHGVRFDLLKLLLEAGEDAEAAVLVRDFPGGDHPADPAVTAYAAVLLAFRRGGAAAAAPLLREARRANRHALEVLAFDRMPPHHTLLSDSPRGGRAAVMVRQVCAHACNATPGAREWLRAPGRTGAAGPEQEAGKGPGKGAKGARRKRKRGRW